MDQMYQEIKYKVLKEKPLADIKVNILKYVLDKNECGTSLNSDSSTSSGIYSTYSTK